MAKLTKAEFVAKIRETIETSTDFIPGGLVYNKWHMIYFVYRTIEYDWELPGGSTFIRIKNLATNNPPTVAQILFEEKSSLVSDFEEILCKEALRRLPYITSKWLHVKTVIEYEFSDVHYESPLGTTVTKVHVGDDFYVTGIIRDAVTKVGISGMKIFAYQTDVNGTPVTPSVSDWDISSGDGSFAPGPFEATEAGNVWFVTYDEEQAPV